MSLNLARGCTTIRVSVRILLLQLCLLSSAKGTWVYWTVTKVLTSIWNFKYCPIFRIRLNQTHLGQCCGSTYLLSSDAPNQCATAGTPAFARQWRRWLRREICQILSTLFLAVFALNDPYHNWIIKVFIRICDTLQFDAFLCFLNYAITAEFGTVDSFIWLVSNFGFFDSFLVVLNPSGAKKLRNKHLQNVQ